MLQLYLTPGERLGNTAAFILGPGVRIGGERMPTGSSGRQDRVYPVSTPLVTAGVCHEKLRLIAVTDVIRNILGGPGATEGRSVNKYKVATCNPKQDSLLLIIPCASLLFPTSLNNS